MIPLKLDWTEKGDRFHFDHAQVITEIERMDWEPSSGLKPFCQGHALHALIHELRIPKVTHVALHGGIGAISILGIRAHYRQGEVDIYAGDDGLTVTPICMNPKF